MQGAASFVFGECSACAAEVNGEQEKGDELSGECFCRSDADFWVGSCVKSGVASAWNGRIDDVADGEDFCASASSEFNASVCIGRFSALADGDESIAWREYGVSVSVFAGDVDASWNASEFFEVEFGDESGVVARAACDDLYRGRVFEV